MATSTAQPTLQLVECSAEPAQGPRNVNKNHLVNRLNYLNFQDQTVMVGLRHVAYDNAIFLKARPLPCSGERLDCTWAEDAGLGQLLKSYRFDYLLVPDGKRFLLVHPEVLDLGAAGLSLILPVACREFHLRKIRRHPCSGISVQLSQHGVVYRGEVLDFTPVSLRIQGGDDPPESFSWINPDTPLNLRLFRDGTCVFSGPCRILGQGGLHCGRSFVLHQVPDNIQRYKGKNYRNRRQKLVPSPNIIFDHPVIERRINLKVCDISGTGFAIEENAEDSVLMPGLILPEIRLSFAQGLSLTCRAQVVYRNPVQGSATVRCGLAVLDMDIHEHVKLLSILHQVLNQKSYVCTEVDLDDLWDFFFETGFIYPQKYAHFQSNKDEIKQTYARLYGENPHIARHFIYQDRGIILGHMAMVRFYRDSWMIHHHAARKSVTIKAGLAVLEQISNYLNELENFYFAHLRYVFCYFRPDNKFPNRVFGGFARQRQDPRVCSLDRFGYAHYQAPEPGSAEALPDPWELTASSTFDRSELASFYQYNSGGLLVDAFDLEPGREGTDALAPMYRELGFRKERYFYSLRREGNLKAFIVVNVTDAGFNMADLTNCVSVIVLDEELAPEILDATLAQLSRHYDGAHMPVLTYPHAYLERNQLPCDKVYDLWILDLHYSDDYFKFCDGLFRAVKKAPEPGASGD